MNRKQYLDHPDPEYQRWGRTYGRFPGVAECDRLIRERRATGAWADIVVMELAENSRDCFPELVECFHANTSNDVAMFVMLALERAVLPASVEFLALVAATGNPKFVPYAVHSLQAINTRESRKALFSLRIPSNNPRRPPVADDNL